MSLGRQYSPLQYKTHKKSNLGARDYSCAVSGFGQALPPVTTAEDLSARHRQQNVPPHARKKHLWCPEYEKYNIPKKNLVSWGVMYTLKIWIYQL